MTRTKAIIIAVTNPDGWDKFFNLQWLGRRRSGDDSTNLNDGVNDGLEHKLHDRLLHNRLHDEC